MLEIVSNIYTRDTVEERMLQRKQTIIINTGVWIWNSNQHYICYNQIERVKFPLSYIAEPSVVKMYPINSN